MSGIIPPLDFPISYHYLHRVRFPFTLIAFCKTSNTCLVSLYFVMENASFFLNDLANETWRRNLVVSKTDKLATERLNKTRNCFPEM